MNFTYYRTLFIAALLVGTSSSALFAANKADWDNLIQAIQQGNLETVQVYVPAIIKPHATTKGGHSLIQIARHHNKQNIIDYFAGLMAPSQPVARGSRAASVQPVIGFYDKDKPYYEFTNFYESSININGVVWPTTEHYFQAQKFTDPKIQNIIRTAKTPREAFDLANSRTGKYKAYIRKDWDTVKDSVMLDAVRAKFTQHAHLAKLLLDTGSAILEEQSPYDAYWGTGVDKNTGQRGQNKLGIILMQVRRELRAQQPGRQLSLQQTMPQATGGPKKSAAAQQHTPTPQAAAAEQPTKKPASWKELLWSNRSTSYKFVTGCTLLYAAYRFIRSLV